MKPKIILASTSPRRKEILEKMELDFEIIPSDYDESIENPNFSYEKIEKIAYNKAKSVLDKVEINKKNNTMLILSADTVVVLNNKILGKPKDKLDAINTLKQLSGQKHSVVTSICVINTRTQETSIHSETSFVEFMNLSDGLIQYYVDNYNPLDKAGSYGIQELPDGFIKNIEGSFENIIGLCSISTKKILNEHNM